MTSPAHAIEAAGQEIAGSAAPDNARFFVKPDDAQPRNSDVLAIIATGGTFLCDDNEKPRSPKFHEDFFDFIVANKLLDGFLKRGLYKNEEGEYLLRDGTRIVYRPLRPSIDSTNATYKERLEVVDTINDVREKNAGVVGFQIIHGTDTAAETAQFLDLVFGRDTGFGIAVVSSQEPANAEDSDGPPQFWGGFEALHRQILRQAFVVSNKGQSLISPLLRKFSDASQKIYEGALLAYTDLNNFMSPEGEKMRSLRKAGRNHFSMLPYMSDSREQVANYSKAIVAGYNPKQDGNQEEQSLHEAIKINNSLKGIGQEFGGRKAQPINGALVQMAGSGNIPEHANIVMTATDNMIPIFAVSEVPGAETVGEDGKAKYSASAVVTAHELGLNNLIILPATRPGSDMRPSSIMAAAAHYAEPRTAEFLLLCHLFSSFAWTPEDNSSLNQQITGDRQNMIDVMTDLSDAQRRYDRGQGKKELSQKILLSGGIMDQLRQYIPHIVDSEGRYHVDRDGKLQVGTGLYGERRAGPTVPLTPVRKTAATAAPAA